MTYDKKQTDELIKEINKRLDYSANLEQRKQILEELSENLLPQLYNLNFYYSINKTQYANNKIKERIDHTLEKVNEYILFYSGEDAPPKTEHTYKRQSDLKDASANEISLESYMSSTNKMKNKKIYNDYSYTTFSKDKINQKQSVVYMAKDIEGKNVKVKRKLYSVTDLIRDMERCPYLKDYDDYNDAARDIIKSYEEVVFNIDSRIKKYKKSLKKSNNKTMIESLKNEVAKLKDELHSLKNGKYGLKIYYKNELSEDEYSKIKPNILYELNDKYIVRNLPFRTYVKEIRYTSNKETGLVDKEYVYDELVLSLWIGVLKNAIGYRQNNSIEIDKDKIAIYRQWAGLIYFRNPLKESNRPTRNWYNIDLFDKDDIRKCLNLLSIENLDVVDKDIISIKDRIEHALDNISLTDNENMVIDVLSSKKGVNKEDIFDFYSQVWSLEEIADRLKLSSRSVQYAVDAIIRKLNNYFISNYSDYYYLNVYKGKYKVCSKCNEQKPATLDWFSPNPKYQYGLHYRCKECNK